MRTAIRQILLSKRIDPYLNNVVLFLKGDGENGSTSIVDSSPNPKIITRFGDTQTSTAQSKYGGSSIFLDGTGDYVSAPHSPDFVFGADDFTIETWIYALANNYWFGKGDAVTVAGSTFAFLSSTGVAVFYAGGSAFNLATGLFTTGEWQHLALTRNSSTLTCWKNGVSFATTSIGSFSLNDTSSFPVQVGAYATGAINAYFDSFRITKACRYTTNFSPETDAFMS